MSVTGGGAEPLAASRRIAGGCLCGAVRFEATGPFRQMIGCHCRECRRLSGHHVVATQAYHARVRFERDDGLRWFRSSGTARRGFCATCGSNLLFQVDGSPLLSILAGALDDDAGFRVVEHIWAAEAGGYYELGDAVPAHRRGTVSEKWLLPPEPD